MLLISIFHLDSKTSNLPRPGDSWFNSCVLTCQFVWTGSSSFSQHEKTTFRMVENPPRSNPHGFSPEFQSITSFNKHPLLPTHFSSFLHIFHHFPRVSQRFPQIFQPFQALTAVALAFSWGFLAKATTWWIKCDNQQQKWRASLKNSKHLVFQLGISPRWRFIAGKIPNNGALLRFFWQKNTCNKHGGVVRRENQRFLLQGDFPASHFWWHRRVSHF